VQLVKIRVMSKKYNWFKIADSMNELAWQNNLMCVVDVNDKKISLAKFNGQVFAFAYKCPHAGGIMAEGFVDAVGNAVCPLHRYKFSLQNGRNVSGEGYYLKTYPVELRENEVYIGFEEKGFLNWL
jgi:3-phenylpropionate/trans-cinnamate dioxygenase ferredoxin subunit